MAAAGAALWHKEGGGGRRHRPSPGWGVDRGRTCTFARCTFGEEQILKRRPALFSASLAHRLRARPAATQTRRRRNN